MSEKVSLSDGLQVGIYGPGQNGGLKIGGRRTNWKENADVDEIGVAQRFSLFTNNDLTEFKKEEQGSDVDVVGSTSNGSNVTYFQITRLFDSQFWKELSGGATDRELSIDELVELVSGAITRKSEKYAIRQKSDLTLLIDVNPAGIVETLVSQIRTGLSDVVKDAGFKEVWLVGAGEKQIFKL